MSHSQIFQSKYINYESCQFYTYKWQKWRWHFQEFTDLFTKLKMLTNLFISCFISWSYIPWHPFGPIPFPKWLKNSVNILNMKTNKSKFVLYWIAYCVAYSFRLELLGPIVLCGGRVGVVVDGCGGWWVWWEAAASTQARTRPSPMLRVAVVPFSPLDCTSWSWAGPAWVVGHTIVQ